MIIKGKAHGWNYSGKGGGNIGDYLLNEKNTRAEVLDIRGTVDGLSLSESVDVWRAMDAQTIKPLYHAILNPDLDLSREEWETALAIFEKEMGFQDQPRALVLHEHKGREHLHAVYSRLDDQGRAISDSWNYLHHEHAAREIERTLGLEHTRGAFTHDKEPRPERAPDEPEAAQAKRHGQDPKAIKAEIRSIYETAENAAAFVAELEACGFTLARGDSRDFVILDDQGGTHSLGRATGEKAAALREYMAEIDRPSLPSVDEAREQQTEDRRRIEAAHKKREMEDEEARQTEQTQGSSLPPPDEIRAFKAQYKRDLAEGRAAPAPGLAPGAEGQAAALGYLAALAEAQNDRAAQEPRPMHPDDHAAALARHGDDTAAAWAGRLDERREAREGFKQARDETTDRATGDEDTNQTQATEGGENDRLRLRTTAQIAGDYIRLCQNPLHDLRGWLDEDRRGRGESVFLPAGQGTRVAEHDRLRPLREEAGAEPIATREDFRDARAETTDRATEDSPAHDAPEKAKETEQERKAREEAAARAERLAQFDRMAKDAEERRKQREQSKDQTRTLER